MSGRGVHKNTAEPYGWDEVNLIVKQLKSFKPAPPPSSPQVINNNRPLTFPDALHSWWSFHYFGNVNTQETSSAHSPAYNLDTKQLIVYKRIWEIKLRKIWAFYKHIKENVHGNQKWCIKGQVLNNNKERSSFIGNI